MAKRYMQYAATVSIVTVLVAVAGLSRDQVLSIAIFVGMISGTLFFWKFRLGFGLMGIAALLVFGLIDIPHIIEFAGLDIILFLIGMMIIVGFLEERHFFEYIVEKIIHLMGSNGRRLTAALMLMSALFAALVDEVTSILFMTSTVLYITRRHSLNPIPFILMIVFATNIGSSATVVGNPVGVMIALKASLTFGDFIRWATPISVTALVATMFLSFTYFSKDIQRLDAALKNETPRDESTSPSIHVPGDIPSAPISSKDLTICWMLFLGAISLLVMHAPIETLLGLKKNSMLLGTALGVAGFVLILERDRARELIERRVDWWTLSFFLMLFASAGTLKLVGVTQVLGTSVVAVAGTDKLSLLFTFSWIAGVMSAFMDNVLAIALFIPVVQDLGNMGVPIFPLWWGMLFAGTFFGNLTPIGSTANIVALGILERMKLGRVTFGQWIKPGLIVSLPTMGIALSLLYLQLPLMP